MRVVFMGTPDFARESLQSLYESDCEIVGVFTQADKPQNRGQKLTPPPVKELALLQGTPVHQPERLRDDAVLERLRALAPDIIVVVAYGKILPPAILALPRFGCVNVHASLLPRYRGAAPIQWAILDGERETGVSIMQMDEGLDTGAVIAMEKTEIKAGETSGELFARLAPMGAQLLVQTLQKIKAGEITHTAQDEALATYASPLVKKQSEIDWTKPAFEICNQIHGLNPWPGAKCEIAGRPLRLHRAEVLDGKGAAGSIIAAGKHGLEIACGTGSILVTNLQAAGKKAMAAADYIRGNPFEC